MIDGWLVAPGELFCSVGLALKALCGQSCCFVICFCLIFVFKLPYKKKYLTTL